MQRMSIIYLITYVFEFYKITLHVYLILGNHVLVLVSQTYVVSLKNGQFH